jgi:hypothetical protein
MKLYKFLGLVVLAGTLGSMLAACGADVSTATPAPVTATATAAPQPATTTASVTTEAVPTTAASGLATVTPAPTTAAPAATPTLAASTPTPQPTSTPTAKPTGQPNAIRSAKWPEVFKNDPNLEFDTSNLGTPDNPYVNLKNGQVGGFPVLNEIVYVDMDGDGVEEAAILLNSGGTAGATSFLIYRMAGTNSPQLATYGEGYKARLTLEKGKLVVINALYSQDVPNCCPNAFGYETYVLKSNKLQVVAERFEGVPDYLEKTVSSFYELLNARRFDEAYKMLSANFQTANPYKTWAAGYATMQKVSAEVTADKSQVNTVQVKITSTDSTSGGGVTTRNFTGTWKLQWNTATSAWVLNEANISEIAKKGVVHDSFKPIVRNLASFNGTILLPTYIYGTENNTLVFSELAKAGSTGYDIELSLYQDCHGATACRLGSVLADNVTAGSPLEGSKVSLASGITGYYDQGQCGASCSDASLMWKIGPVRYTITLKSGSQADLVKMANSAINNGAITPPK